MKIHFLNIIINPLVLLKKLALSIFTPSINSATTLIINAFLFTYRLIGIFIYGPAAPKIAKNLEKLGKHYSLRNKYNESIKYYKDAEIIYRSLPENYSNSFLLARCLSSMALVLKKLEEHNEELAAYEGAIEILTKLRSEYSIKTKRSLVHKAAKIYTNTLIIHFCIIILKISRLEISHPAYHEAEKKLREIHAVRNNYYSEILADNLINIARLNSNLSNHYKALKYAQEAHQIYSTLSTTNTKFNLKKIKDCLILTKNIFYKLDMLEEALSISQQLFDINTLSEKKSSSDYSAPSWRGIEFPDNTIPLHKKNQGHSAAPSPLINKTINITQTLSMNHEAILPEESGTLRKNQAIRITENALSQIHTTIKITEDSMRKFNEGILLATMSLLTETLYQLKNTIINRSKSNSFQTNANFLGDIKITEIKELSLLNSLNNLAIILGELGYLEFAADLSAFTVLIARKEACSDKNMDDLEQYFLMLAISQNNAAIHVSNIGRYDSALEFSQESVHLIKTLHTHSHKTNKYAIHLIKTLNNLSVHLKNSGLLEKSLSASTASYNKCKDLYRNKSSKFLLDIIITTNNFCNRLNDSGEYKIAFEESKKTAKLTHYLYRNHNHYFTIFLSAALANVSIHTANNNKIHQAVRITETSLKLLAGLHKENKFQYKSGIAVILSILSCHLIKSAKLQPALTIANQAVLLNKEVKQENHSIFNSMELAYSLNNLGAIHGALGKSSLAIEMAEESISNMQVIFGIYPQIPHPFLSDLATCLNNLRLHLDITNKPDTIFTAIHSTNTYRRLFKKQPATFAYPFAESLYELGKLYIFLEKTRTAQPLFLEIISIIVKNPEYWQPILAIKLITNCITHISDTNESLVTYIGILGIIPNLRLSQEYTHNLSLATYSLQTQITNLIWKKIPKSTVENQTTAFDTLPILTATLQSPDLQRWLIEQGRNTQIAKNVAAQEDCVRKAINAVHLCKSKLTHGIFYEYKTISTEIEFNKSNLIGDDTSINPENHDQWSASEALNEAENNAQIAIQALQHARNELAEDDPAFAAAYRPLDSQALFTLLNELKHDANRHRADPSAPAALLCFMEIPAYEESPAMLVGMLVTSHIDNSRIQAIDFPGLYELAHAFENYAPVGQRSCQNLRSHDPGPSATSSQQLDELLQQLEQRWWQPLQQLLTETLGKITPGMLHICTHGSSAHLPFAATPSLGQYGNVALFQWPGLPYLRLAQTLKQKRDASTVAPTVWQIGHDCAWSDDQTPLPMAAVEAKLLQKLIQAEPDTDNNFISPPPSVEGVTDPSQLRSDSAGLVLCSHGSLPAADDTYVRMAKGKLDIKQVLQKGLSPNLAVLPVCFAGQVQDDAHGNALGLAAGFLLAGTGVVVGSSKAVPDVYMAWFSTMLLWFIRQGLSAYEAATRARIDFSHGRFPPEFKEWIRNELSQAMMVLHPGGSEHDGVLAMFEKLQEARVKARAAGEKMPADPLANLQQDWPWDGFRSEALPLSTGDEETRMRALRLLAEKAFNNKSTSQSATIMREMAAFIVIYGI